MVVVGTLSLPRSASSLEWSSVDLEGVISIDQCVCVRERERRRESERRRERWRRATQPNKEKIETCANDESLISGQDRTFFFHLFHSLSFSLHCSVALLWCRLLPSLFSCFLADLLSPCQMSVLAISSSPSVSHFLHFTFTVHFQRLIFFSVLTFTTCSCIRTQVYVRTSLPTGASRARAQIGACTSFPL